MAAALAATFAWMTGPAFGQDEPPRWTAPNGAFSLTVPDMWNPQQRSEPEVLLFLRAMGFGPSGPSAITCTIEQRLTPADVAFTRGQLDALNNMTFQQLLREEGESSVSTEIVDGVQVESYRADRPLPRELTSHHFGRVFLLQDDDRNLERYIILCDVMTASPGVEGDFALMREFLSSLRINTQTAP
ncbi:MAG: hypothetical protein NT015_16445 [Alphaproteobacteria bacterium]|nr:hypothetical protein [Alphaproteobacteria bacterium]